MAKKKFNKEQDIEIQYQKKPKHKKMNPYKREKSWKNQE